MYCATKAQGIIYECVEKTRRRETCNEEKYEKFFLDISVVHLLPEIDVDYIKLVNCFVNQMPCNVHNIFESKFQAILTIVEHFDELSHKNCSKLVSHQLNRPHALLAFFCEYFLFHILQSLSL